VNGIVAILRSLKRFLGTDPLGEFIPMTTGNGPLPSGSVIRLVSFSEFPLTVTVTVSVLLD